LLERVKSFFEYGDDVVNWHGKPFKNRGKESTEQELG